jgi:hypothetical protein
MHGMDMSLLLILFLGCAVSGALGLVLGYFLGRRSAERERQAGFPVLRVGEHPDRRVP